MEPAFNLIVCTPALSVNTRLPASVVSPASSAAASCLTEYSLYPPASIVLMVCKAPFTVNAADPSLTFTAVLADDFTAAGLPPPVPAAADTLASLTDTRSAEAISTLNH
ncbi:hypothetical protein [Paenibacillus forsythiae]|uniref:hypothetical protein n=1 Tax=Paenibacillus forsythiae TaxID=365616 RepID=UPI0035D9A89F